METDMENFALEPDSGGVVRELIQQDSCPFAKVAMPNGGAVTLTVRHDDVVGVLTDSRFSRDLSRGGGPRLAEEFERFNDPNNLTNMDPPRHSRIRRLLSGTFTPRQIQSWRPRARAVADTLIGGFGAETDLIQTFTFPLPIKIICEIMGVGDIDPVRVKAWAEAFLSSGILTPDEQMVSVLEFHAYIENLVTRHRDKPGTGLFHSLIAAGDGDDHFTQEELITNLLGLIIGGFETTATALSRGILALLRDRDHYAALVADPSLMGAAVEEILRLEAPAESALPRLATEDIRLPSGLIRKGEVVVAGIAAATRDPSVNEDPDRFDLRRADRQHVSFGRGPHYCVGANLARMEMQEALTALTERLPDLELAIPADEIPWTDASLVRRPVCLPVRGH
jgi:cytochrome P450